MRFRAFAVCLGIVLGLASPGTEALGEDVRVAAPAPVQKLAGEEIQVQLSALCEAQGRTYGARAGQLAVIAEEGTVLRSVPIPVGKVAGLAPFEPGKLIVGDASTGGRVFVIDLTANTSRLLFTLSEVNAEGFHAATVLTTGELASLAYDGSYIYLGIRAGFSSSIFKIDPSTKRVITHGWAPGDDPVAMTFYQDRLVVLDGKGRQIRSIGTDLRPVYKWIDIPTAGGSGLTIKDNRIKVLSTVDSSISTIRTDMSVLTTQGITLSAKRLEAIQAGTDYTVVLIPRKYAVLICGDVAQSGAGYNCFWNDTYWMYETLLAKGFTKKNIYVLYGNGVDWACPNPRYKPADPAEVVTDFPATIAWVNKVFDGMLNGDAAAGIAKVKDIDTLFVWTFDHGSGGNPAYLCLWDGDMKDDNFAAKVNAIPCEKRAFFMQQCHSGGFMDELAGAKTFLSAACAWNQSAFVADTEKETYNGGTYTHGEYNYYVISALSGSRPTGNTVNADQNSDNKVSCWEMHDWEVDRENSAPETPQLDNPASIGNTFFLGD